MQDLACIRATLEMQDVLLPLRQVTLWAEVKPAELLLLKGAFPLPVEQEESPPPQPPAVPWKLTPSSVGVARRRHARASAGSAAARSSCSRSTSSPSAGSSTVRRALAPGRRPAQVADRARRRARPRRAGPQHLARAGARGRLQVLPAGDPAQRPGGHPHRPTPSHPFRMQQRRPPAHQGRGQERRRRLPSSSPS
ncbi:MAG: hypothetical protein WDO13_12625 [Verrucomicrobiota bacterium]